MKLTNNDCMIRLRDWLTGALFLLSVISIESAKAQVSSDDLFQEARKQAFDNKDYVKAIALSKTALKQSPDYTDIAVFLGRLYTWSDKTDSARAVFESILQKKPGHEDASMAYGSLEYWNNNSDKALSIVQNGLSSTPESGDLLLLKAKVLNDLNRMEEANATISELLKRDPKNAAARSLAERIKDNSSKNNVGLSYDFVYFDKQFDDPWHLASVDYGRQTKFGSVIGRFNYANRFATSGAQVEVDAYPKISRIFYSYINGGYSQDVGIFPKYRAGFSLYANLPKSFEAEAGLRFLHFTDNTTIYTFSASKYVSNYWINLRTYLTPSGNNISQSYSLNLRYYYGSADDYLSLGIGTGISPDESSSSPLLGDKTFMLRSNKISTGYRHLFNKRNVFIVNGSWFNQEYFKDTKGNQINIGLGYQKRF